MMTSKTVDSEVSAFSDEALTRNSDQATLDGEITLQSLALGKEAEMDPFTDVLASAADAKSDVTVVPSPELGSTWRRSSLSKMTTFAAGTSPIARPPSAWSSMDTADTADESDDGAVRDLGSPAQQERAREALRYSSVESMREPIQAAHAIRAARTGSFREMIEQEEDRSEDAAGEFGRQSSRGEESPRFTAASISSRTGKFRAVAKSISTMTTIFRHMSPEPRSEEGGAYSGEVPGQAPAGRRCSIASSSGSRDSRFSNYTGETDESSDEEDEYDECRPTYDEVVAALKKYNRFNSSMYHSVYVFLNDPGSSGVALAFHIFMALAVLLQLIVFILATMDGPNHYEDYVSRQPPETRQHLLDTLPAYPNLFRAATYTAFEEAFYWLFSAELVLRVIFCETFFTEYDFVKLIQAFQKYGLRKDGPGGNSEASELLAKHEEKSLASYGILLKSSLKPQGKLKQPLRSGRVSAETVADLQDSRTSELQHQIKELGVASSRRLTMQTRSRKRTTMQATLMSSRTTASTQNGSVRITHGPHASNASVSTLSENSQPYYRQRSSMGQQNSSFKGVVPIARRRRTSNEASIHPEQKKLTSASQRHERESHTGFGGRASVDSMAIPEEAEEEGESGGTALVNHIFIYKPFARVILNITDVLANVPLIYILALGHGVFAAGQRRLEDQDPFLHVVISLAPMLRVLRILRVSQRYSWSVRVLHQAFKSSIEPLLVPTGLFLVFCFIFGSIFYFLEPCYNRETCAFKDVFAGFYFTIVTVTTVGYGDQVPQFLSTRTLTVTVLMLGVIFLSMPITVVGDQFQKAWTSVTSAKEKEKRAEQNIKRQHDDAVSGKRAFGGPSEVHRRNCAVAERVYGPIPSASSRETVSLREHIIVKDFATITSYLWKVERALEFLSNRQNVSRRNTSYFGSKDQQDLWFRARDAEDAHKRLCLAVAEARHVQNAFQKAALVALALETLKRGSSSNQADREKARMTNRSSFLNGIENLRGIGKPNGKTRRSSFMRARSESPGSTDLHDVTKNSRGQEGLSLSQSLVYTAAERRISRSFNLDQAESIRDSLARAQRKPRDGTTRSNRRRSSLAVRPKPQLAQSGIIAEDDEWNPDSEIPTATRLAIMKKIRSKRLVDQRRDRQHKNAFLDSKRDFARTSSVRSDRFNVFRDVFGDRFYSKLEKMRRKRSHHRQTEFFKDLYNQNDRVDVEEVRLALESNKWRDKLWLALEFPKSASETAHAVVFSWVLLISVILMSMLAVMLETVPDFIVYGESSTQCARLVQTYCRNKKDPAMDPGCFRFSVDANIVDVNATEYEYQTEPFPQELRYFCDEDDCFGIGDNFGADMSPLTCDTETERRRLRPFQEQLTLPRYNDFHDSREDMHRNHDVCLRPECFNQHYTFIDLSPMWTPLEIFFVIFFAVEVSLRVVAARSYRIMWDMFLYFDIISVLPTVLEMVIAFSRGESYDAQYSTLQDTITSFLQLLRVLRVFKFMRHQHLSEVMFETTRLSGKRLVVPLAFLIFICIMNAVFIFYIEQGVQCFAGEEERCREDYEKAGYVWSGLPDEVADLPRGTRFTLDKVGDASPGSDFFDMFWFSIVTMTSVGYGDITPKTNIGCLAATVLMLFGLFYLAMPIAIIGTNFHQVLEKKKQKKEAAQKFAEQMTFDAFETRSARMTFAADELQKHVDFQIMGTKLASIRRNLYGAVNVTMWEEEEVLSAIGRVPKSRREKRRSHNSERRNSAQRTSRRSTALVVVDGTPEGYNWHARNFEHRTFRRSIRPEEVKALQATLEAVVKVHKAFEAISARLVDMQRGRAEEDEDVTGEEEEAIDKGGFRIAFGVVDGGGPVVGD